MRAEFTLTSNGYKLIVRTEPHIIAWNLQQTEVVLFSGPQTAIRYGLTQDERKALAAFLLSIPDDRP